MMYLFLPHNMLGIEKEVVRTNRRVVHLYFPQRFEKFELPYAFSEIQRFLCTFIMTSAKTCTSRIF